MKKWQGSDICMYANKTPYHGGRAILAMAHDPFWLLSMFNQNIVNLAS